MINVADRSQPWCDSSVPQCPRILRGQALPQHPSDPLPPVSREGGSERGNRSLTPPPHPIGRPTVHYIPVVSCVCCLDVQFSGIPEEDDPYKGVVVFANTSSLPAAALALLRAPALRASMERRAVEFMAREQFSFTRQDTAADGGVDTRRGGEPKTALTLLSDAMKAIRGTNSPTYTLQINSFTATSLP